MPDGSEVVAPLLLDLGVGATTAAEIAPIVAGVGEGALGGALLSGVTGGDIGKGALTGGLTGGAIGLGPITGLTGIGGEAALGAAGGGLGSFLTGGSPLTGAAGGALAGGLSGALTTPTGTPAGATTSGGASAAGAGAAGAGAAPVDLTAISGVPTTDVGGGFQAGATGLDSGSFLSGAPSAAGTTDVGGGFQAGSVPLSTLAPPSPAAPLFAGTTPIGGASGDVLGTISGSPGLASPAAGTAATGGAGSFDYGGSTLGKVFSSLGIPQSGLTEAIAKNPGALLSAGGLGYNLIQGQGMTPEQKALKGQAQTLEGQGSQLMSYLQSGNLPAGAKAALSQASDAAKARIISGYASRGMPADPSKNSALAQELDNVDLQIAGQTFQIADNLYQQGLTGTQLSSSLYNEIISANQQQNQSTGQAIANFASALSGGTPGLTLKVA